MASYAMPTDPQVGELCITRQIEERPTPLPRSADCPGRARGQ